MDRYLGSWRCSLENAENIDAFFEAIRVPPIFIPHLKNRQFETVISKAGNGYQVISRLTSDPEAEEVEYKFELGKEYEVTDHDGRTTKRLTTFSGENRVDEVQTDEAGNISHQTVELLNGGKTASQTVTCCGVSTKITLYKV